MKLSVRIILALVMGAIVGLMMNLLFGDIFPYFDKYLFTPLGKIFLHLIMMLVVPLVFFSIALGTSGLGDPKKLGRIGLKTVGFFIVTTAVAITIAISLALILKPGEAGDFDLAGLTFEAREAPPAIDSMIDIIPTNPVKAFAEGNMLQIITFSVFVGLALAMLGKKVRGVVKLFEQANEIMMFLVNVVMKFAPYGAFGLIASAVGKQGFDAMKSMGLYMFVVLFALLVHMVVVYGGTLSLLARRNPVTFFKEMIPVMTVAFSTSSSSATLPVSMEVAQKRLQVPKSISSFVQPLGAAINMDGTAIMQGVATIFIAQVVGADLTLMQLATVVLTAVLASIGTASVPGVGLVMLTMVLQSVNLPVEGIALIIGIDRLLDMARTAVNVTGDTVCAVLVTETEKRSQEQEQPLLYDEYEEQQTCSI